MTTTTPMDTGPPEALAERFAALWNAKPGEPPDLLAFLNGYPQASTRERVAVILVDQRERLRAGIGRSVKDYLAALPELAADPNLTSELVKGELTAQQELGEEVNLETVAEVPLTETSTVPSTQDALQRALLAETQSLWNTDTVFEPAPAGPDETQVDALSLTRDGHDATVEPGRGDSALAFQLNTLPALEPSPGDSTIALRNTTRFTIDHRLGTGGMGVVYQAYDHQRGERVALKTMRRIDPLALYRFKQEFRALTDLSHPNLVNLYELIAVGEVWFFTMELVPGVDFIHYIRSAADPDPGPPAATVNPESASLRPAIASDPMSH